MMLAESAAGVKWTPPAGWVSSGATSMRAATYTVAGAECVVYFFGQGQGGSVDANIQRWEGQFTQAGKPAPAKVGKKTVHGLNVTTVDTTGVYAGMAGPMMTQQAPKSDYRMIAAIVEAPGGNLFVKFTGPVTVIKANEAKFNAMVDSFQKQ